MSRRTPPGPSRPPLGPRAEPSPGLLQARLDVAIPPVVGVGAGTALFVCGWCFCATSAVRALELVVDDEPQPLMAFGMPRRDVFEALHPTLDPLATDELTRDPDSPEDPQLRSFRSGFWGLARIRPRAGPGASELSVRARLADGGQARARLAHVATVPRPAVDPVSLPFPEPAGGPRVAICMATHEPPLDLFRRQIESIRAQTHRNWICVVSDDCSSPARVAAMRELLDADQRFVLSRSPRRLGFYDNFERALALAPAGADYVGMADQDDAWQPDKLAALLGSIGTAQLVYSDARIIGRAGEPIADSYWSHRRNNHSNLFSLLIANAVTGAASLFRRGLLDYALPFPPRQFSHFHDHWIALTARALGEIAFVDRPLYDYVQHGGAVLGHDAATRMPALRERIGGLVKRDLAGRVRLWRLTFFADSCRLMQYATVLSMRCGDRMTAADRRSLEGFLRADRSPLELWRLGWRAGRELVGRPETLGAELGLLFSFAWRHLLVASSRGLERPRRRLRIDARPPTTLTPRPGRRGTDSPAARVVADKIAPLELAVDELAPSRVNVLIPKIDLDHLFGGYIAKLNLALRLANRGLRVRVVTVDPVGVLPSSWARRLESFSGLAGLGDRVEFLFGRESERVPVSPSDRFVATTWWTAHIAHAALRELGGERFLYLIQEFEPFTFPMGTFAALADESYTFPHVALFSSELLRDHFRRRRLGVYADGEAAGDGRSIAFENAITAVDPPSVDELAARTTRRLLFYARPEPHAARNMYELGVLALSRAAEDGVFGGGWELTGVGTVESRRRVELGAGAALELVPRRDQRSYAELLREHDLGLALMYTPHPSLVPIEMASAGMLTVTNSFENKTAAAMAAISPNLIAVPPTVDGVADGLRAAAAAVDDLPRRLRGSAVRWSRDWGESFDDELLACVTGWLEGG